MKKIYMILAAMTLLSMSLNAQTTKSSKKGVVQPTAPTEKVDTPPDGYFRIGPSRASTTPVTPPYSNSFGSNDEWNWWEAINNNNDNRTWTYNASGYAQYQYSASSAADDWLVTAPVTLIAGRTYKFYISAWARSSSYPEKLEVKLASANTAAALSAGTTIIGSTTLTNTSATTLSNENVTVSQDGNYYFGIHAISDRDEYYLYVDNLVIDVEALPEHDLAIALSAPSTAGAGNTVDVTATVTNNGDFAENGYTVTVSDGTNIVNITAQEALGIGETTTFTVQFATSPNAGGSTVNYTATVACTDDADATNNSATASTSIINLPPPENVAATATGNNGTMTWDAPSNLPIIQTTVPETVTENFDDTSVFPSFSIGGITATQHTGTIGDWTVYTPSSDYVYGPQNVTFDNDNEPQAWTVMNPTAASWNIGSAHSGDQFMISFCDAGDSNGDNIQTTNHWLISPELSGNAQTITFWERVITTQYGDETYEVLASSTDNNPANFSLVASFTSNATSWTQRTASLPAGTKYFAIRHTAYDIFGVMIDDVTYEISHVVETQLVPESYNIYLDGELVGNVNANTFSYTFNNVSDGQHQCAVSAVYSYGESAAVPATFTILPTPNAPAVSSNDGTTSTTITITPDANTDGQLVYYVDYNGSQTQDLTFPRGANDYTVEVHAYTTATSNYNQSPEAVVTVTIPALPQTAAPSIGISSQTDNEVVITATGNGTVILNIPGYEPATGNGSASITVPRHMSDYVVTATATAQASGELISPTTTEPITVPGMSNDGWTQMTGTYNNPNDLLSFEVKVGNDTTDIMLIDQFMASTVYNNHPNKYTYVLKETIDGEEMSSTPTSIPVYKTNSTMYSLYTEEEVLADDKYDDNKLMANVLNSEMDYDVVPDHNALYYSLYRGGKDEETPVIDEDHRISQLQKFEDKVDDNVVYYFNENHRSGIAPLYEHIGSQIVERIDQDYITGTETDKLSYVPVIWTFGLYTAREDGKNNSYGSDIKNSYLGKVDISVAGYKNDGDSITGQWKDDHGTTYCVYAPIITLQGHTPEVVNANDGDTYEYVPYMYRVWCTYENAHNFTHVVNPDGKKRLVDAGPIEAPFLIGEVTDEDAAWNNTGEEVIIGRALESGESQQPWSFGVPVTEPSKNVEFVARFYYKKIVTPAAQVNGLRGNRGDARAFAIAEKGGDGKDITTGISELGDITYVVSRTYVNAQGMQSDVPFDGLNIVITRYSDGTTSTTKVVR